MPSVFNNFNSVIGNQVNGTLNIAGDKEGEIAFIKQQLDLILERIESDALRSDVDMQKAVKAIEDVKGELASKSPKKEILERSLDVLGAVSSAVSLVDQIRVLLRNVLQ